MDLKKYSLFISVIVLGFSSAYLVSAYFNNRFISIQLNENIQTKQTFRKRVNKTYNFESDILKYNIFDLKISEKNSLPITNSNKLNLNQTETNFNGKLVGILAGDNKQIVVLNVNNKIQLLDNTSKTGNKILNISKNYVEILYNNKKYKLKFQQTDTSKYLKTDTPKPQQSSQTEKYTITKTELKKNVADINKLIKHIFVSPYYKKGEFIGYRISRIRRNSILYKIGIRNGDIIVRINGEDLKSPEKMLTLFSEIENLSSATIDLIRRGKKKTIFVTVEG